MLNCLSNDSKMQMRLNIKQHRQKLLQYLENTNDTVLKPKIKLISNDIEKSNLNHNDIPKIASNTEDQTPKVLPATIKVTSYRNKPTIRVKTYEAVINTKPTNPEVLTDNNIKTYNTRSSITVNQLPSNIKVKIQDEPLSSFQIKQKPVPEIEIEEPRSPVIKKLKEQLIEELFDSSSSEEIDDNISVGNNDNWNEIYQRDNGNDVDENDSSNLRLMEADRYDGHTQLANDISEEKYMNDSDNSDNSVLDINCPTTKKRSRTKKPQLKIDKSKHRFRKPLDRSLHNAKERACRERIAKRFATLRKSCSYLNSNRRVPSKHSILLAAKKECDLLKNFEKKMLAEKKVWHKANEVLKDRIAQFYSKLI